MMKKVVDDEVSRTLLIKSSNLHKVAYFHLDYLLKMMIFSDEDDRNIIYDRLTELLNSVA